MQPVTSGSQPFGNDAEASVRRGTHPGQDERVSTSMPEFEMPAAVEAPPRPEASAAAPSTVRPAHTADPDASDPLEPPGRSGLGWRHLLVAGLVGAIVGAAIPGGVQLVERAAADAQVESLRTVALEYLNAIADGHADDATAMVPLAGAAQAAPDAVLQSADRIEDVEVRLVHIDGDIGSVEVRYTAEHTDIARTLEAERLDSEWRLTTTLAEPLFIAAHDARMDVGIGGVALPMWGAHLYPGVYEVDQEAGPLLSTRSEPFIIDGDPATRPEVYVESALLPELAQRASQYARAVVRECQAAPDCAVPADAELSEQGNYVYGVSGDAIDVSVQLMAGSDINGQWFEVRVRITMDEAGAPAQWLCAPMDTYATPSEPCPAL